jgi:hypothetical protein
VADGVTVGDGVGSAEAVKLADAVGVAVPPVPALGPGAQALASTATRLATSGAILRVVM